MPSRVARLDDLPYYEQDSGPNITYQFVVKPGSMGLMSSGRVRSKGPTTKAMDRHEGWDQIYIILGGSGCIVLEGERHAVAAGHVVRIPRNTLHGVVLEPSEQIEYVYVNAFKDQEALDALVKSIEP